MKNELNKTWDASSVLTTTKSVVDYINNFADGESYKEVLIYLKNAITKTEQILKELENEL
jgi:hypothetical protein